MKKKSHSIFAVLALALVIAAAIVVFALIRKYTPSKEHEDLRLGEIPCWQTKLVRVCRYENKIKIITSENCAKGG